MLYLGIHCKTGACKITSNGRGQTVPGKQAKFSVGKVCLRFPRVTSGNLPAPAGNLGDVPTVRVRVDVSNRGKSPFIHYQTT